ncbi:unannotated protein [freshwater metagenome]|uniref:Unannotated protein n=1 Tax=freshwater metagenome TaxID=449393 RepID=A0A6J6H888_9ZZZZ
MTTRNFFPEYSQLSEIESFYSRNRISSSVNSFEELLSYFESDGTVAPSDTSIRDATKAMQDIKSELKSGLQDLAFAGFLHQHGGKLVHELEILGSAASAYAILKQLKELYNKYQEGNSVKEIAEREAASLVRKAVSIVTPIPVASAFTGKIAEVMTDRYQYGYKFKKKKSETAASLEDLLQLMRDQNFEVDRIVH